MTSRRIAILPTGEFRRQQPLLRALAELYKLTFIEGDDGLDERSCDAVVMFGASRAEAVRWARRGTRCLAFANSALRSAQSDAPVISFTRSLRLRACFRGASLTDPSLKELCDLGIEGTDELIAQTGERPLWIRRTEGAATLDLVAVPPPVLHAGDYLFSKFHQNSWFSLLPLLHFVGEVSGWTPPPTRACLMFDDPNLHWKTYGYVDYENVAADAAIHNYHTAFAMVPMDAWYVHRPTARLFRNNSHRLSLLIHGNDHTYFELHRPSTPSAQLGLARQALRRIDRFESVSGVPVSRVMAAPHGACSQEMAGALLQTGFDAACISRSSLMSRNPDVTWARSIGFRPAEFLDKGLPVIPRFNMTADPQTRVRFAAFLGQPIIPVGHHDDLKDGLDIIHRIADVVNSIGDARWMDMSRISQTNFQTSRENGVLHVRMFSRRVQVRIPPDVEHICIDRPWLDGTDGNERVMLSCGDSSARPPEPYEGQLVPVEPQTDVTICAVLAETDTARAAPVSRTALRAVIRRQLCEGRDRLRPAVDRLLKRSNKTVSFP